MRPNYRPAQFFTAAGLFCAIVFTVPALILWQKVGDFGLRSILGEFGIGEQQTADSLMLLLAVGVFSAIAVAGFLSFAVGALVWGLQATRSPKSQRLARDSFATARKTTDTTVEKSKVLTEKAKREYRARRHKL